MKTLKISSKLDTNDENRSVAQSVERWSRDAVSRVQFPAGSLGVAFFATGPGWVLICISDSDTRIYLTFKTIYT